MDKQLEDRILFFENNKNESSGFSSTDWMILIATGIVFPAILLCWGWQG